MTKTPITRDEDGELLGFVAEDAGSWTAQTLFGYVFERAATRADAEKAVRRDGLSVLQGVWSYYDRDDKQWFPCVLKEAYENKVTVIRTGAMGYQDPDDYKLVTISMPTETDLVKA